MSQTYECLLGDKPLYIEPGRFAGQAHGAVTVRYGDTMVLVTACMAPETRPDIDFVPLTIDYEERLYAAGKIPGGFIRREGRPSQDAILTCRLTDRPLRPLFPKGFGNEVQIIATVMSADQENPPDILVLIGASAALTISQIPFEGPVGAVRIGCLDGKMIINPTFSQLSQCNVDVVVASTANALVMLESECKEVSEELLMEAIKRGHEVNQQVIKLLEEIRQAVGKPKVVFTPLDNSEQENEVSNFLKDKLTNELLTAPRNEREPVLKELKSGVKKAFEEKYSSLSIENAYETVLKKAFRSLILDAKVRP
ncbi:MAG: polyribonucleotide nucleotidyltransferase, partial [Dehalococcoidia bacterium]|nr:polyribonucleotide nucleotidyltransferase [Dehalococcoidia bacterium]